MFIYYFKSILTSNKTIFFLNIIFNLLQLLNGFPVIPFGQKQIGFPLSISQSACIPQGFGSQGFCGAEI